MANKYIIHGAAFNGDGTASNEAASAGAPGAWNNISILTGTTPANGTLVAGDVVYIRSKTSAGADIAVALPAADVYLGLAAATATSPVVWILDNGSVWSGVDGLLTYTITGGNYVFQIRTNNSFIAKTRGALRYASTATGSGSFRGVELHGSYIDGWRITSASVDTIGYAEPPLKTALNSLGATASRCDIVLPGYASAGIGEQGSKLTMIDCDIELTSNAAYTANQPTFSAREAVNSSASGMLEAIGCTVRGTGAHSTKPVAEGNVKVVGGVIPAVMPWTKAPTNFNEVPAIGIGVDGALGSIGASAFGGVVDSRSDGYYPTLNAVLPDSSSTPWSWKLYPSTMLGYGSVTDVVLSTFSTAASGITGAAVEFLVPTTFGLTRATCYVDITWTDESGVRRSATSLDLTGAALETSTAAWSATTYGATAFDKRKASFTLTGGVKQNTMVVARLCVRKVAGSAGDVVFACPAVVLS